jgi:DNA repair protein RadD
MLTAILNIEGATAAHIDSSVSRAQRRQIIASFRAGTLDAVLNFGVLSTGFDAPRVSAVVIARPTTSVVLYSQMVGRGLRGPASGGNEECNLIDVRDNFTSFGAVDDVYQTFAPYWE